GIRGKLVTGVQTCALPIFEQSKSSLTRKHQDSATGIRPDAWDFEQLFERRWKFSFEFSGQIPQGSLEDFVPFDPSEGSENIPKRRIVGLSSMVQSGELGDEFGVDGQDLLSTSSLKHELGYENPIGVPGLAPWITPAMSLEPSKQPTGEESSRSCLDTHLN